jgi:hypothetical protein
MNPGSDFIVKKAPFGVDISRAIGAADYSIRQCQLVKVFTKLDAPRVDAVLRSSLILPRLSYSTYTTLATANQALVFNVTQKDRVKKLYIGCHFPTASVVGV